MSGKGFLNQIYFMKMKGRLIDMDYQAIIGLVVDIIKFAYPISLIFGLAGKLVNFSLDLILNRKVSL